MHLVVYILQRDVELRRYGGECEFSFSLHVVQWVVRVVQNVVLSPQFDQLQDFRVRPFSALSAFDALSVRFTARSTGFACVVIITVVVVVVVVVVFAVVVVYLAVGVLYFVRMERGKAFFTGVRRGVTCSNNISNIIIIIHYDIWPEKELLTRKWENCFPNLISSHFFGHSSHQKMRCNRLKRWLMIDQCQAGGHE